MRGRKGDDSKKITIKIVSKSLPVRHEASRMGSILCQIQKGFIVQYSSEAIVEDILWVHISSGWICSKDTNGWPSFEIVPVQEGNNFWAKEYDNRKRISAAIGAMLTRSYSLMEARRFTKLLLNQCSSFQKNYNPLTGLPDVSLDDLLVGINASVGLKPREVFEFIKITASQQSNPHKCLNDMCTELFEMLDMRPTLWIKNNLGILTTTDLKQRNDTFVMAAAKNDVAAIERFLEEGQELSVLHSSLDYTALHAAADFGAYDAIVKLLSTGLSVNIKDAKYGQTPLHFAAQSGRSQIASLLLEKNADRTIANFDGVLPFEIAHEQGHFPCREILKFPPPEIQHAVIVDCTHNTITVAWTPPTLKERLHSDIINYMVEWVPLENDKYGHGQQFETTETTFTVNNLHPASGHSFVFYSRSVSGVSKQSTCMLIHFTDSCTPDAPEPIELIKTTKNGLLLNWCDPDSDNGAKITLWELELIDYGSLVSLGVCTAKAGQKRDLSVADNVNVEESTTAQSNEHSAALDDDVVDLDSMEEGQDEKEEMEEPPKRMHDNTPAMTGHRIMLEEKQVVEKNRVKYHRSIIHRNLNVLRKFVMGLAPGCQYGCRVRAENEFGWSLWSEWAGPYVPQSGISCVEFSSAAAGEEWMKVGWLEPQLYNKRKVTAFELQVSQPLGPLCRQFSIYKKADDIMDGEIAAGDSISYEFQTLTNDTKESHYVIKNIKPGNRYQYRVRPQINNEWLGWDFGMLSDVIVVPPCAPDPPTDVHLWNSSDQVKAADPTPADTPGSSISFDNEGVGHDFIVIAYTAGNSGGAPVIEYGMECARIRDYDYNDVMNAEQAAGRQASLDTVTNGRLQWEDVTPNATMMGPCAFKINHLLVGSHYVFRVKQKNEVGWSMFSLASPIMSTCHTPPPDTPIVTEIGTTFAVLKWTVSCAPNTETAPVNKSGRPSIGQTVSQKLAKDLNNFTVLDYQVAVGHLPTDDMAGVITSNINSKDIGNNVTLPNIDVEALSTNISWIVGYTRTYDDRKYLNGKLSGPDSGGINENGDVVSCVLLENLAASSYYIVRVKVLTVAGWSPWSKASDVFRASSVQ